MQVVAGDPEWVARRIPGCERGFGDCRCLAVEHGGQIVAGVVYHNWTPEWGVIELSAAATDRRWMTRPVIHDLLAYPFGFCRMVMAQHEQNSPARSIWRRLGASETIIPDMRGDGRPNVVATLKKADWLNGRWCLEV